MISSNSYVINLAISRFRWQNVERQFKGLNIPYTRIEAVDGNFLYKHEIEMYIKEKPVWYKWMRGLSRGEIGAYLSHKKAWKDIINSDQWGGFVFEDDFIADSNLPAIMEAIENLNIKKPVLIKLYTPGKNESWYYESKEIISEPLVNRYNIVRPKMPQWGCLAYYINSSGALNLYNRSKTFNRPVDDVVRRTWETGVVVLHVSPSPIMHANYRSAIDISRIKSKQSSYLHERIHNILYESEYRLMSEFSKLLKSHKKSKSG